MDSERAVTEAKTIAKSVKLSIGKEKYCTFTSAGNRIMTLPEARKISSCSEIAEDYWLITFSDPNASPDLVVDGGEVSILLTDKSQFAFLFDHRGLEFIAP